MHKFVRNLITEWRRLNLPVEGNVIVAVSGGADSLALLHAMCDLRERQKLSLAVTVGHFDHGLRGEASKADAEFVSSTARSLGVAFISGTGNISKRGNLEQNARAARYKFLRQAAENKGAFAVLTGHTINDQAETFLLNLLRGSGLDGLSAMMPVRPLDQAPASPMLIRPLLRWAKRDDTEDFCRHLVLEPRLDPMNEDMAFTRVRIRKRILPILFEFNPKIVETLAATAARIGRGTGENSKAPSDARDETPVLAQLRKMEQGQLYSFLREWVKCRRGGLRGINLKHIESIERLIYSRKSGRTVELPGGHNVVKTGGKLAFVHIKVEN